MNPRIPLVAALALSSAVLFACSKKAGPSSSDPPVATSPSSSSTTVAPTPAAAPSPAAARPLASLKSYLPPEGAGGYRRVLKAGRDGYAEAALEKDGKEVAILSIVDAERMAFVRAKFDSATEKVEGFPLLTIGKDLSTILVKDRLQIKVLSKTLDEGARKAILATFDLKGLSLL